MRSHSGLAAIPEFLPARSGLPLRVLHLARALAEEIELDIAVVADPPAPAVDEPFRVTHHRADWSRTGMLARAAWEPWRVAQLRSRAVGRKVRENSWDIVQAHTLAMMRYVPQTVASVFDTLDSMTSVARMLAEVDSRNIMRPLWRLETIKTLQFERAAVRRATAVTVCSDSDGELFERMGARRVMVVPKGVDLDARPHHLPPSGAEIIFVGYFAWRPNVEGALELCDQIFPRIKARVPSTTLTLVGAAPPPGLLSRAGPAVRFTGEVDEVLPHLHSARVTVMPLRAGGGTRIKVLEALSTGAPVVATPFAVEGIAVRDGVHALIAQSPADLAAAAATVIENDELAASLSRAGRALVEQRYGWSTVARPLVDLHRELAELPAGRQRPGVGIGHA